MCTVDHLVAYMHRSASCVVLTWLVVGPWVRKECEDGRLTAGTRNAPVVLAVEHTLTGLAHLQVRLSLAPRLISRCGCSEQLSQKSNACALLSYFSRLT